MYWIAPTFAKWKKPLYIFRQHTKALSFHSFIWSFVLSLPCSLVFTFIPSWSGGNGLEAIVECCQPLAWQKRKAPRTLVLGNYSYVLLYHLIEPFACDYNSDYISCLSRTDLYCWPNSSVLLTLGCTQLSVLYSTEEGEGSDQNSVI